MVPDMRSLVPAPLAWVPRLMPKTMPKSILMPAIAVLCVVGSFALRNSLFDVYVMFAFGLLGIAMKWFDIPVVPLLLAALISILCTPVLRALQQRLPFAAAFTI